MWTNAAWYYTYMSLDIRHTHVYNLVGEIEGLGRTEYKCSICGHRIGKAPNGYLNIVNVGKQGSTWRIQVENPLNKSVTVYYNKKMCYYGDGQNWTGLTDINYYVLPSKSFITLMITENYCATSIAVSYIRNDIRYVTYAYGLSTGGDLKIEYNSKDVQSYSQNGMTVRNLGKNGNTWLIGLTNNTGSSRRFNYNAKMCNSGDAQYWKGLSDVSDTDYIFNNDSITLAIQENGTATSIAISYLESETCRKIFYADNLNASGTMTAYANTIDPTNPPDTCIAEGTLITLADGRQVPVETLTGDEMLLVWNMYTGTFDSAPILCIDSDPIGHYEVIELSFSDGTTVEVISEHGFWDVDLNKYVYLDGNAAEYIGHNFMKQDGNDMEAVTLLDVNISTEVTTAWSPVTYGHLCYYVNGMLSMPGGISGLFNIFEGDSETMMYDTAAMAADIEEYGLFTYEELNAIVPVPEAIFDAVNGQYLKVSIGKGLITYEQIGELIDLYSGLF